MYGLYNNYFNVLDNIVWKVGIYVRLSREDEKDDRYNGQSESIENQINYLKPIVVEKKWILVDTYIDDGYTGTNFDRPNFQRMIRDVDMWRNTFHQKMYDTLQLTIILIHLTKKIQIMI